MASREHPMLDVGVSPRGALCLCRMAKAQAYLLGRDYVVGEDVQDVWQDVCAHRVVLTPKARLSGKTGADILSDLLSAVESPDKRI